MSNHDDVKRTPMDIRLAQIKHAFEGIALPEDEDRESRIQEIVDICKVSSNLTKELHTHPGVYAYLASEQVALKDAISRRHREANSLSARIEGLIDLVISMIRGAVKITVDGKKEVVSLIRMGELVDSPIYQELVFDNEDQFAVLNEKYAEVQNLIKDAETIELELLDLTNRHALVEIVVACLGYQKLACMKAIVERETSGLAQQTK